MSLPRELPAGVRYVRLFVNGRNQAVRIPREFELPGEAALMRKDGDRLILDTATFVRTSSAGGRSSEVTTS